LKDNKNTDRRIREIAVQIFVKNSPVPISASLAEDLANGSTSFSFVSPQMAGTPKGRAFQLAGDIFEFVTSWALKLPIYSDMPKHTPVPEHISKDMIYKFYVLKEFDDDFAKDFHKKFDPRIKTVVPGLEGALWFLMTKPTQETCRKVYGVRSGEDCASKIFADASSRSPS
jgi:hypothetical protein